MVPKLPRLLGAWYVLAVIFAPVRIANLLLALILTFLQEVGQVDPWYLVLLVLGMYWVGLSVVNWLIGEIVVTLIIALFEWRDVLFEVALRNVWARPPPRKRLQSAGGRARFSSAHFPPPASSLRAHLSERRRPAHTPS